MRPVTKKLCNIGVYSALLLLCLACSQVIDLPTDEKGGQLVIFGRISNSTEGNEVAVTRTRDLGQAPEPVSDARVKIVDDNGQEEFLVEKEPGLYELLRNTIRGEEGNSYHLEVMIGDRVYKTAPQVMPRIIAKDSVHYEVTVEEDVSDAGVLTQRNVVKVYGDTRFMELPEEFYIRWDIEEVYTVLGMVLPSSWFPRYDPMQCYIINDLNEQEAFLLNGKEVRSTELRNQHFATRTIDRSFAVKHYFNIIQSAINKETYEYWSDLNSTTTRVGSIFDQTPGPVSGNIFSQDTGENVLGFFEVISVDTARVFLTNNDIRIFWDDPCELNGPEWLPVFTVPFECVPCLIEERIVEEECIFCTVLPNSTTERPGYF